MKSRDAAAHLRDAGATFIRKAKHGSLYRLPNGATILVNCLDRNGGDRRTFKNFLSTLNHALAQGAPNV